MSIRLTSSAVRRVPAVAEPSEWADAKLFRGKGERCVRPCIGAGVDEDRREVVGELIAAFDALLTANDPTSVTFSLLSNEPGVGSAALHEFFGVLAQHPKFSGGWQPLLVQGGLWGTLEQHLLPVEPHFCWLGLVASQEPGAEAAQLDAQLRQFGRDGHVDEWLRHATFGQLAATVGPQPIDCAGDEADVAFAMLGEPVGSRAAAVMAATRLLDGVIETHGLLGDGGVLTVDGPRPHARAMMTAAWLQRIAERYPIVLAIDSAHLAGPFLAALVEALHGLRARLLIVLSGHDDDRRCLSGPLGHLDGHRRALVEPPDSPNASIPGLDSVTVASVLGAGLPTGIFLLSHVEAAVFFAKLSNPDPQQILDELIEIGWVRRLVPDVYCFADDSFRLWSQRHRIRILSQELIDAAPSALARAVAADINDFPVLPALVVLGIAHEADPYLPDVARRLSRLLARCGYPDRALQVAGAFTAKPLDRARLLAWKSAVESISLAECEEVASSALHQAQHLNDPDTVETLLIASALLRQSPGQAADLLARAIGLLGPCDDDPPTPETRLRIAAAHLALVAGSTSEMTRVLGPTERRWLSNEAGDALSELQRWADRPGVIARSTDVLSGLQLIHTIRSIAPNSEAAGLAMLSRLETIEAIGRIDRAPDALALADGAIEAFSRIDRHRTPERWRARRWRAWCLSRLGDHDRALAEVDALLEEQANNEPTDSVSDLATRLWRGRIQLAAGQPEPALDAFDACLAMYGTILGPSHPDVLATRLWRADCFSALNRFEAAAAEASDVLDRLSIIVSPEHEQVLLARQRRGSALTNLGLPEDGVADLDSVVTARGRLDLPEATRLLTARHSRAVCLLRLERLDEALADLDEVVLHRAAALAPSDELLINARADRGVVLLLLSRGQDALVDLDEALAQRLGTLPPDDLRVLVLRQQRALCLNAIWRSEDAHTEVDIILATAAHWSPDHPFLAQVHLLHEQLPAWPVPRPASTNGTAALPPPLPPPSLPRPPLPALAPPSYGRTQTPASSAPCVPPKPKVPTAGPAPANHE